MKPEKVIVLGMHPYPWHHQEISDTMRLMTEAFKGCDRVFINPSVGFRRAKLVKMPLNIDWKVHQDGEVLICTPPLETLPSAMGIGRWKKAGL